MEQRKHWKHHVIFLTVFLMVLMSFVSNTETLHAATKQVKSISLKIDSKRVTKKTVTLYCGDKKELKVTVSPKSARKKVTFSSSNKNVASVSSKGVIKAKKAGTAKIKVTVSGQNKKTTYVKIKVKNVSLSLSKKTASLKVGKSLTLQVKVSPKRKVKWSSSNTDVATVSSKGVVKAKKAGTAKITAQVGNKKAVCKVTVKAEDKNGIRFKNSSIKVAVGGDYDLRSLLKLEGTMWTPYENQSRGHDLGVYVNGDLEIFSSNSDVVNIWHGYPEITRNGNYSYVITVSPYGKTGVATITAKLNGKTAKCKVTVTDPKIDKEKVTKTIGENYKLSVQGTTSEVTWESENEAIAKVDSQGNVMAVGIGTTYVDAFVDTKILRCAFTTEIVPQFLNTYKIEIGTESKGKKDNVVVLADTVLRTSQANKFDTKVNENGVTVTDYNWEKVGDIAAIDFSAGNVYPVFELEKANMDREGYYKTEIYLVGSSQNAVIKRLDSAIGGGTDTYWEYTPGDQMGTITIYSRDSSPALYSVTVDGHALVFATDCREYGLKKPTDKPANAKATANYVRANASTFDVDVSGVMASVAKYVLDKVIETAVNALIDKFFPW